MGKLRFSDKEIGIQNLLRALAGAPEILVRQDELHTGADSEVISIPRPDLDPAIPISVYPHLGKYLILTGAHKVPSDGHFKARLASKQLIKKVQIMDTPAPRVPPPIDRPMHRTDNWRGR